MRNTSRLSKCCLNLDIILYYYTSINQVISHLFSVNTTGLKSKCGFTPKPKVSCEPVPSVYAKLNLMFTL